MRQKVGPLLEALSLNHFPECHGKESLSGCLCATVIRKGQSQPARLAHTRWHVDQRFSKCGPRSCSISTTWALVKDTNSHQPIAVLPNQQGPAVCVVRSPPGKRAQVTVPVKVQNHWCRPGKATGAYTSEFKVTSDETTNSSLYSSFSNINDLVCEFECWACCFSKCLLPSSPPAPSSIPHLPLPSTLGPTYVPKAIVSELYLALVRAVKTHRNLS